ncbi:AraC family transcriptional regulator [Alteromonas sp. 1_MG-2023]|uniref:AraC family transcriptional regulator n=1 Tax=Alteromonas sp. 1_MG-2023 TaxID=3062669 RepID=UPI0026E2FFC1|nr:AraC family transcriptional regulator [Alteromonas sp. 1_MG-2023]MDO6475217.1 AraC family transcriptional regulator [Alteromonas sp. 1_MG-2023]
MLHSAAIDIISDKLADRIGRHTAGQSNVITDIAGLSFYRKDAPTECTTCFVEPSIALVVQGEKRMALGSDIFHYNRYRFLITSLDLPAQAQILKAERAEPYLGLALRLDFTTMSELLMQASSDTKTLASSNSGMSVGNTTPELLDACDRLVSLLDDKASLSVLAPLIKKEIYWRVLNSEQGDRLRHIISAGSQGLRIAKAIDWLKTHFTQSYTVEELAERAQMSKSTFHHHFRQLTSMSPLQYQKSLKLMEARRLMIGEQIDASDAAYRVGYESPSQFSREYSRYFGNSPKRDVEAQWRMIEGEKDAMHAG